MRILVAVSGGAGSRISGPGIRGWEIARALGDRHDVTVAVAAPSSSATQDGLRRIPFTRRALTREARLHDAVLAPTVPPYLFTALAGTPTITVADQYDPIGIGFSLPSGHADTRRRLRSQQMAREIQLRFADVVTCAGERQRALTLEDLDALAERRATPPPVVSVPFGLSGPPSSPQARPLRARFPEIGPDDPVVLWWGKVWKWFDANTAIRAFDIVARRRPDARLVISAGKAPTEAFDQLAVTEEARDLARDLGLLNRNVFFLDEWIQYDRRHEYLQDADVGLTLHADTIEAPFAARARYMDYLWCALPCVLARGDEIAERFGAQGFAELVSPADADGAASALLRLIDDERARAAAGEAGRELADAYRWPIVVRPLVEAIEAAREARTSSAPMNELARAVGGYYARRAIDLAAARLPGGGGPARRRPAMHALRVRRAARTTPGP